MIPYSLSGCVTRSSRRLALIRSPICREDNGTAFFFREDESHYNMISGENANATHKETTEIPF
jgi:hypothetical protein